MSRLPDPFVRQRWINLINAFERSDDTVQQFCDDHDVSPASFYQWKRRLRDETAENSSGFVQLMATRSTAAVDDLKASIVRMPGGIEIEIDPNNHDALLAVVGHLENGNDRRQA